MTDASTQTPCGLCRRVQTTDIQPLCTDCATGMRSDLRAVTDLAARLREQAARQSRLPRQGGGSGDDVARTLDARYPLTAATTASPVDFTAAAAAERLVTVVRHWARTLADAEHPPPPAPHGPTSATEPPTRTRQPTPQPRPVNGPHTPAHAVFLAGIDRNAAEWLADKWLIARRHPWAPDAAHAIGRAVRDASALIDSPPETYFAGTCDTPLVDPQRPDETHACGWHLQARLGDRTIRCRGCGTHHDVTARRDDMLARLGDQLVTVPVAARALSTADRPVTASMIRGWKRLGHLDQALDDQGLARYDDDGRPLYRFADVLNADRTIRTRGIRLSPVAAPTDTPAPAPGLAADLQ